MGTSTLDGVDDEISTPVIPSIFVRMEDFDTLQVKRDKMINEITPYIQSPLLLILYLTMFSISHSSLYLCVCVCVCVLLIVLRHSKSSTIPI
jgi:hypothetical protein